ncbi:MAG: phosphomannomutase/phosphoglucomutase [Clostridia bacterium]|nr:phosphomannomutase/phosphoglucomutase [Clostridia bacterium]
MSLLKLKSGTDIRGTAIGENIQLTNEAIQKITVAFVGYISEKLGIEAENLTVCVGHDSRISANRIKSAITGVLNALNVKALDCSLSSTPAMFMTTVEGLCNAAIQITASHHPSDKNGLKFFTRNGCLESEDIGNILTIAENAVVPASGDTTAQKIDFMSRYSEILRDKIKKEVNASDYEKPLDGFHIVVDAGNGAGGFFATDVLEKLGADITGSQFLEPDGNFPNHIPNPENEVAMSFISRAVTENNADLGVIFDTDVDRAACVDASGNEINRNSLIALSSVMALEGNEGGTIVTDSVTSDGLKEFIENSLSGKHYRYKRGYKNVINKAIELNKQGINCPLAIETSGHAALRENYFLDDGAYLMTKIIILAAKLRKEGKTVDMLLKDLKKPLEEKEMRFKIELEDFKPCGEKVISDLEEYCKGFSFLTPADDNREGFRVSFDKEHGNGWLLLRMSVHDPILPLNIESNEEGGVIKIAEFFYNFIKEKGNLDISAIKKFLDK